VPGSHPNQTPGDRHQELLTRQWPAFAERLLHQTPIRSILVMPLSGRLHGVGCTNDLGHVL
jgi:hypothetical protein